MSAPSSSPYLEIWLTLGRANPWIREATDPPFTSDSFYTCRDEDELAEKLCGEHGWSLGATFVLDDLCFIQQVDGGSEWLVIKQHAAFESFSCRVMGRERFLASLRGIQQATVAQCKALKYRVVGPDEPDPEQVKETRQLDPALLGAEFDLVGG